MHTLKNLVAIAVGSANRKWEDISVLMQARIKSTDRAEVRYFKGLHLKPDERYFADKVRVLLSLPEDFTFAKLTDLHRIASSIVHQPT